MTYMETQRIRILCFKHKIRFYIAKDRYDRYSVRIFGKHATDEWNLSDYQSAVNCVKHILRMKMSRNMDKHYLN